MRNTKAKFVFNTMVSNESHCIERMLNSVYKYIDYWVIQDNGSTDGTQGIINNFFKEKGIPGFLYEIPWSGCMGQNRDHTVQTCLKADHNCDWILRVDADEILEIDDDFDWSVFDNTDIQSFNVFAKQYDTKYFRTWIWNTKLPWKFKHDKRHECIVLDKDGIGEDFQRINLSEKFRHVVLGDGKTWTNPLKYYMDALELEKDLIAKNEMKDDHYHLFYVGKSYSDTLPSQHLPFGDEHNKELARRGLFYFDQFVNTRHNFQNTKTAKFVDEMAYVAKLCSAHLQAVMGNTEEQIQCLKDAESFCPQRNEHLKSLAEIYQRLNMFAQMHEATYKMMNVGRKNPFPNLCMMIDNNSYYDTSNYPSHLHEIARSNLT
jgi:glycosyltransferase involved in cell wall biosynthesis